jgi:2-polyprenyl-3-methyl-5-hydroxy-6-metoxy-1,4-benzoquinol methylase
MMKRIPEQELMVDPEQAQAYASADFEQPHSMFIDLFSDSFSAVVDKAHVLDLGCGPGDITFRFARSWQQCHVHGIDGSDAMLLHAEKTLEVGSSLQGRVCFFKGMLPDLLLPSTRYDIIISNSLLHHLPDPAVLWQTVKAFAAPEALIFIMDLKRPESVAAAAHLRDTYAQGEPEVLRQDFYNSLLAAFEPGEIQDQLHNAGLAGLNVQAVSDRHVVIGGRLSG